MDIQFIDITSFIGISSDAEHYYAKIGEPKYLQEDYLFYADCKPNNGVMFTKDLHYYPNRDEAKAMVEKDNSPEMLKQFGPDFMEHRIDDYVINGTIRFPSILEVIKAAREYFPDSTLCFSIRGSMNEFVKYMHSLSDDKTEEICKLLKIDD